MVRLDIPVPPMLEAALDIPETYDLHLRLFRGSDGTARYADGRAVGPAHEPGLLAFSSHPVVATAFGGRDLLTAGGADHWLVLDRHRRRLDLVPAGYGRGLLFSQWPPWIPFHVGRVAWDPAAVRFQPRPPTPAGRLDAAVREMLAWLDIIQAWRF